MRKLEGCRVQSAGCSSRLEVDIDGQMRLQLLGCVTVFTMRLVPFGSRREVMA